MTHNVRGTCTCRLLLAVKQSWKDLIIEIIGVPTLSNVLCTSATATSTGRSFQLINTFNRIYVHCRLIDRYYHFEPIFIINWPPSSVIAETLRTGRILKGVFWTLALISLISDFNFTCQWQLHIRMS